MVFTKHGGIESPRLTQKMRPVEVRGRLFSFGDSLSTIRKPDQANVSVNGRFSTNGWNWCDYFRFGFHPFLEFSTATSWAYEGAYATRDIAGQVWSTIQPIPSFDSQINTMIAAHPVGSVNDFDVAAIYFGTNDSSNYAGGAVATAASFSTAIVAGINRLIAHGFKNFVILMPESRYFAGGVPAVLQPQIDTLEQNNRGIKFATVNPSSAVGEFTTPYIADGTHYVPAVHERLGEIAISQFLNQSWIDKAADFTISANGATTAAPRTIGFKDFNPNTNGTRFVLADQFNCFQAIGNQRLTLRSYNGLVINGAFEANNAVSGTGGGKNDPCLMVQGNFWEHAAILRLDAVGGVPITQSPYILGRTGGVDRFKVSSDGTIIVNAPAGSADPIKADVNSTTRFRVQNTGQINLNVSATPIANITSSVGAGRIILDDTSGAANIGIEFKSQGTTAVIARYLFNSGGNPVSNEFQIVNGTSNAVAFSVRTFDNGVVAYGPLVAAANVYTANSVFSNGLKVVGTQVSGLSAAVGTTGYTITAGGALALNSAPTVPATALAFTTSGATVASCANAITAIINILRWHGLAQ